MSIQRRNHEQALAVPHHRNAALDDERWPAPGEGAGRAHQAGQSGLGAGQHGALRVDVACTVDLQEGAVMKRLSGWIATLLLMASSTSFAADAPAALATRLLDHLDAAQYSPAEAMFSAEMKAAVPA